MQQRYTGKINTLILFFLAAIGIATAQPNLHWQHNYGTAADDYALRMFPDRDGNIIIMGTEVHADFAGNVRPYMVMVKLDPNGHEIWKEYHDVAFNTFNPPVDYYFGKQFYTEEFGETLINVVVSINNRTMMYKVLDESGEFYYAEDIPAPVIDVAVNNDKVYAWEICSHVQSCYGPDSLIVQRFDPTPDSFIFNPVVWTFEMKQNIRTAAIQGHYDFDVQDLRMDAEGNVYVLVQIERWDFQFCTDCADAFIDAWNYVFKFNEEGELVAQLRLDVTTAVVSAMGFVNVDGEDLLVRIDDINAAGTELETTLYDVDSDLEVDGVLPLHKQYAFIQVAGEDAFVVLSNSFDPNHPLSLGLTDMVLSKLDDDGGLIWSRRVGGAGYDFSRGLLINGEEIFVLANTDSGDHDIANPQGATDIWLANFSEAPLSNGDEIATRDLSVYPNPASQVVYFDSDLHDIAVFDVVGRQVLQVPFTTKHGVDVSALPDGLYVLEGVDADGVKYAGRMVIQ